jgi:hypothetical protein
MGLANEDEEDNGLVRVATGKRKVVVTLEMDKDGSGVLPDNHITDWAHQSCYAIVDIDHVASQDKATGNSSARSP